MASTAKFTADKLNVALGRTLVKVANLVSKKIGDHLAGFKIERSYDIVQLGKLLGIVVDKFSVLVKCQALVLTQPEEGVAETADAREIIDSLEQLRDDLEKALPDTHRLPKRSGTR